MRSGLSAFALALSACAANEPPPNAVMVPIAPVSPQPMPQQPMPRQNTTTTTLTGTIGGQRFDARSALLVRVNENASASSSSFPGQTFPIVWSFLLIFDRPLGCEEVGRNFLPNAIVPGERYVKYQVQGQWPLADGRTFTVGGDPQHPAADGFAGNVWRGSSGSLLRGTVRVLDGAAVPALLEMDVSTATTGSETSGTLRGTVALTVCP